MLTPRQRNQIKAALTFWNAVAETSRVHPMEHPKVQQFFQDGNLSSLTAEEINDLITLFDVTFSVDCKTEQRKAIITDGYGDHSLMTIRHLAHVFGEGVTAARLALQVRRENVRPILFGGCRTHLYRPRDLVRCARHIVERDAQMEQKYHAKTVHKTKSPPASGNKSG